MNKEYTLDAKKILKDSENIALEMKHSYVGTEHLLLSLLKNNNYIKDIFLKESFTYDMLKEELITLYSKSKKKKITNIYTPLLKRVIFNAESYKEDYITPKMLLKSLIEEGEGIAIRILINKKVNIDKIYNELEEENLFKKKLEIYKIGKDFNLEVSNDDILVGREKDLHLIMETLIRKNKNNPLLIGEAGVGKTAIVEELARRINNGNVPKALKGKKIVSLEMSSLVSGTKYRGEFEEKLEKIIKELEENPNIILFIDEIHTISNAGGAEGAINASDILKPYLARGQIKVIGATTAAEYNKFILKDKALNRRFELIKIKEPNEEETKDILLKLIPSFEKYYNVLISNKNIEDIISYSNKYFFNRYNPDKSIDLLDSVCAMMEVENKKYDVISNLENKLKITKKDKEDKFLLSDYDSALKLKEKEININNKIKNIELMRISIKENDIKNVIYRKLNIPMLNNKIYNDLKSYLLNKLIGQDIAIKKIVETMKLKIDNKPLSILLVGSTGVGKTETVKEIAKFLKMPLLKLDMSEYNTEITINKLIGVSAGYVGYDDECLFDKIKTNPWSSILLDELEKAHPKVLNLFLQILDEGYVTNSKGEKIDFKNTIIFMTSNIKLNKKIGFLKEDNNDYQEEFSKEFRSRITKIIEYEDVTLDMIKKYLEKNNLQNIYNIKDYDYKKLGFRGLSNYIKKIKVNNG